MLDLLFAVRCAGCGASGSSLCEACVARFRRAPALVPPDGLASCRALVDYEGAARAVVTALKYRNQRACVRSLAQALHALVIAEAPSLVARGGGVTWAPTSPARRRERGFDQAEVLARSVARGLGLPCRALLRRTSVGHQTGSSAAERWFGPAFEARGRRSPPVVLIVDDVITTGATLAAAAYVLRTMGAREVHGLVFARTPNPVRDHGA